VASASDSCLGLTCGIDRADPEDLPYRHSFAVDGGETLSELN